MMDSQHTGRHAGAPDVVDWKLAVATAGKVAPAGPKLDRREMGQVVEEIRYLAGEAVHHVAQISRMSAAALQDQPVLVVDRAGWSRVNAAAFEALLTPGMERAVASRRDKVSRRGLETAAAVGGVQLGAVLGLLSTKVLGQYEPFATFPRGGDEDPVRGRLLLVAPNMVEVCRQIGADRRDFFLWVCLHEQTHRVQFAQAPWLKGHVEGKILELTDSLFAGADDIGRRLKDLVRRPEPRTPGAAGGGAILRVLRTPEQQELMSQLTAVMSLMEGHANVVMDRVGDDIIPSVEDIRARFTRRAENQGPFSRWLFSVLGMEQKMRQYIDGAKFVDAVVREVGMDRFNLVWAGPENLPTEAEIHDPGAWVARVAG